jgi:DNA-binding response OmpR family regulator
VYYKYDFAKKENIGTSFADQNSVSLGMLDIALKKTTGLFFCREISFGPRAISVYT